MAPGGVESEDLMYWIREIMGWVLIVLGLWLFYLIYFVLLPARRSSDGAVIVMGIFLFRGGIHLLKVAVAARSASRPRSRRA